jgi:hypothetical protein
MVGGAGGVVAALLVWMMRPMYAPGPTALGLRELPAGASATADERAAPYLPPATRPDEHVRGQLDQVIAGVSVTNAPLDQVLADLARASGVNVHVHWRALEAAGIAADMPVTLNLRQLPASRVLTHVLEEAGGGNVALRYRIEQGVVEVSTAEELSTYTVTRIYDVRDLIEDVLARDRRLNGAGAKKTEEDAVNETVNMLREAVEPGTWDGPPLAHHFAGHLIVTRSPEVQDKLLGVLTALRRGK